MSHHCDDDETTFRVVTAEQAARRCKHGSVSSHGQVGEDWCPGALHPLAEPWRAQLVDQMNLNPIMFTKLAPGGSAPLADFKPLGWVGYGRIVWYGEPIYNALVKECGFDPLAVTP